ncbi:hypothetical protein ACFLS9_02350 [Bacteroidota bacterium]
MENYNFRPSNANQIKKFYKLGIQHRRIIELLFSEKSPNQIRKLLRQAQNIANERYSLFKKYGEQL